MNLTRPLTDDQIGGSGASITRRAHGAAASRAVTPAPDPFSEAIAAAMDLTTPNPSGDAA
jgi:hypothetical protein